MLQVSPFLTTPPLLTFLFGLANLLSNCISGGDLLHECRAAELRCATILRHALP